MTAKPNPLFQADCALSQCQIAVQLACDAMRRGDHPNRIADFARDIGRWAKHAESHLATAASAKGDA